jgi:hypothetical protein
MWVVFGRMRKWMACIVQMFVEKVVMKLLHLMTKI